MLTKEQKEKYMHLAFEQAKKAKEQGEVPIGAVVVDKDDNVIGEGYNRRELDEDATQHAEMIAIRQACEKLKTYDLSDYILYTSCEPCPMCLSAIIWSNIKQVYYGCTREDAENIGFRDNIIYDYLQNRKSELLNIKNIDRGQCLKVFENYSNINGIIY